MLYGEHIGEIVESSEETSTIEFGGLGRVEMPYMGEGGSVTAYLEHGNPFFKELTPKSTLPIKVLAAKSEFAGYIAESMPEFVKEEVDGFVKQYGVENKVNEVAEVVDIEDLRPRVDYSLALSGSQ